MNEKQFQEIKANLRSAYIYFWVGEYASDLEAAQYSEEFDLWLASYDARIRLQERRGKRNGW